MSLNRERLGAYLGRASCRRVAQVVEVQVGNLGQLTRPCKRSLTVREGTACLRVGEDKAGFVTRHIWLAENEICGWTRMLPGDY